MLKGWILLVHRQSFIGAAVDPDEDGRADGFGAVGASGGLGGADVAVGCVLVALLVAPDALGGCAAVVWSRYQSVVMVLLERVVQAGRWAGYDATYQE